MAENFDKKYFVFKVVLDGSDPSIWRRFHMLPISTFYEFGGIIEQAFGWAGDLHQPHKLEMQHSLTKKPIIILPKNEISKRKNWLGCQLIDEEKATVGAYFSSTNRNAVHTYDFRIDWRHLIELEEIKEFSVDDKDDVAIDCCVDGEEQAPPEGCAGIGAYYRLLRVLKNPAHKQHDEVKTWVLSKKKGADILAGAKFDPKKLEEGSENCSIM